MMSKSQYQASKKALLMLSLFVLGLSFYFQYIQRMAPCPLCLMQRFCVFMLAICCLLGLWVSWIKGAKRIAWLELVMALAGCFFAVRQLWLQSLPPGQFIACMPGMDVLIRYFSWHDVLKALFWGASDCADVTWQWLGLSMAAWALLYFLFMLVLNGFIFFKLVYHKHSS